MQYTAAVHDYDIPGTQQYSYGVWDVPNPRFAPLVIPRDQVDQIL